MPPKLTFTTLVRTHHITSRKKLAKVRRAATQLNLTWTFVRSGSCPGIMYAESPDEARLAEWVSEVQGFRYKDFKSLAKPTEMKVDGEPGKGWEETESMNEFASKMKARGLGEWYQRLMFT